MKYVVVDENNAVYGKAFNCGLNAVMYRDHLNCLNEGRAFRVEQVEDKLQDKIKVEVESKSIVFIKSPSFKISYCDEARDRMYVEEYDECTGCFTMHVNKLDELIKSLTLFKEYNDNLHVTTEIKEI